MAIESIETIKPKLPEILEHVPYLELLVLFGSRANGNHGANSDWDFAVLYDDELRHQYEREPLDWLRIWSILQKALRLSDNQIDVVILNQCSNILAHNIAETGQPIYERKFGDFKKFQKAALMSESEQKAYIKEKKTEIKAILESWKS